MAFKKPPWTGATLLKRFRSAKKSWEQTRSLHQEAYDYSMPDRETFRFHSEGQEKNNDIYDTTAVEGLDIFANKVQGGYFPSWMPWMSFEPGSAVPVEKRDKRKRTLEKATTIFFDHFHQSNFDQEITPGLKDWGVGTGCIEVEAGEFFSDDNVFQFSNVPLAEVFPERPARGPVKTSWREQDVEAQNIELTWPDADIPADLKKTAKNKPLSKVRIVNGHIFDPKTKTYWQVIIWKARKTIIYSQQFKTKRRIVFRSDVTPGEVFGRGPIIKSLPDIRMVNKVKQFTLQNAALQMGGVYTGVDDGVFNPHTVVISPGSIIPVGSNSNNDPSLRPLERAGDLGLGGVVIEDLQASIKRSLLAEPLGSLDDPVRTATENIIRHQEDMKRSVTSFGRLYSELVVPLVMACVDILAMSNDPAISHNFFESSRFTKVKMVSPLAKQQEMEEFTASQTWFANVSQLGPEVMAGSVKLEDLPKYWADKLSVPATELVREEDERQQLAEGLVRMIGNMQGGE